MEGPLSKWTNVMQGWQYRWFVLDVNTGLLSYYTSKEKMMRGARRGCVRLKSAMIGIDDEDDSTFTITCDQKMFHFQSRNSEERQRWITSLQETILKHNIINDHAHIRPSQWGVSPELSTLQEFDHKLLEADAYLQILIDQVKLLEDRVMDEPIEKMKYDTLWQNSNGMIESVKHTILLMQIAKNTIIQPVTDETETSADNTDTHGSHDMTPDLPSLQTDSCDLLAPLNDDIVCPTLLPTDVSRVVIDTGVLGVVVGGGSPHRVSLKTAVFPETSYSSSDDDDYFFDANEFQQAQHGVCDPRACVTAYSVDDGTTMTNLSRSSSQILDFDVELRKADFYNSQEIDVEEDLEGASFHPCSQSDGAVTIATSDVVIDDDALYSYEDDDEEVSLEKHQSILMHLLSQVKLGMDLTKVVLPTFILERRSLLEMYADFFAHPDLFTSIGDYESAEDRMVQVVKWYLSAFHAGRKSSVAKKPYNPIIGEIFQCYWNIDTHTHTPTYTVTKDSVSDGPVPWASKGDVIFLAEQVSHHPPVSAFYAEHFDKRVQFNAHIWTKSKFLGLSIGVHMVGQACVSVLNYDEEYILTFPNGYGRSILTVPWTELGGKVTISCAKTGYSAWIDFLTKPFYGGKKHKIMGEIVSPVNKRPLCKLQGEWNGLMTATWPNGDCEDFVDTTAMKIIPKHVRPISKQHEFESRNLWKHVTAALKNKNIESATAGKHRLEERQRTEARQRKEHGLEWETKFFHEDGGNWVYDYPLQRRLNQSEQLSHHHSNSDVISDDPGL